MKMNKTNKEAFNSLTFRRAWQYAISALFFGLLLLCLNVMIITVFIFMCALLATAAAFYCLGITLKKWMEDNLRNK
jgi:uncharacterized membrane protein YqjE